MGNRYLLHNKLRRSSHRIILDIGEKLKMLRSSVGHYVGDEQYKSYITREIRFAGWKKIINDNRYLKLTESPTKAYSQLKDYRG